MSGQVSAPNSGIPILDAFAIGVATAEGFFASPRLAAHHNPGDLSASVHWDGMIGEFGVEGLAEFDNDADGWAALCMNLKNHCLRNPSQAIGDYLLVYSGQSATPTSLAAENYVKVVMQPMGITDPTTPLGVIMTLTPPNTGE